ncbi:DUF2726 domain-containing protein [Polaromonas sp.]|uniref:DUF2726 domain-containing protein n=1 Tax=Polaromonas sp. TaxID=1869339 RepID=UPI003BB73F87
MNAWTVIVSGLSLLVGIMLGALLWACWLRRRKSGDKLRLPDRWPLRSRLIVNGNEQEVWRSLRSIFHEHAVMVKIPILRFTRLHETQNLNSKHSVKIRADARLKSEQWLEMLDGLHTTFTVCTMDGKVVGCVDVPGKLELTKASRELKEALLLDCGIAYTVVNAFNLPDASTMRELFLGEMPVHPVEHQVTLGGDSEFHADLTAFTRQQANPAG